MVPKDSLFPYRVLFSLAAAYNLAFGLWAGLFPNSFFSLMKLPPPLYPSLWACLGMVVGLYGLVYAQVARRPADGDIWIWIGLLGKVLGPLGWIRTMWVGELPPRTFLLVLFNDLIWWFPFLFYLLRNKPHRARILTGLVVVFHTFASFGLLWVQGGNEFTLDLAARQAWILKHSPMWVAVWFAWVLCSTSILAFFTLWALELKNKFSVKGLIPFLWIMAIGVSFDLSGEVVNIVYLTDPSRSLEQFRWGTNLYLILGAAVANGVYCIVGWVFSWISWRHGMQRGSLAILAFTIWTVGIGLTVTALLHHRIGILATGAVVMALLVPWAALTAWGWKGNAAARVRG